VRFRLAWLEGSEYRRFCIARIVAATVMMTAWPRALRAEQRSTIDLQPVAIYDGSVGIRTQISVVGYSYGYRFDSWMPYVGAGLGFFTFQARGGVSWLPGDLEESGPIVRLEAQPQILFNPCTEPLLVANIGVGWRWPLERGDPGNPGTALYLLPAFAGGEAFLHRNCGKPTQEPLRGALALGGTLFAGFEW
jgi:hypothetical protein